MKLQPRKKKYTPTGKPVGRQPIYGEAMASKTFSLSEVQLEWLSTKSNESAYLRDLIDRDMRGLIGEG